MLLHSYSYRGRSYLQGQLGDTHLRDHNLMGKEIDIHLLNNEITYYKLNYHDYIYVYIHTHTNTHIYIYQPFRIAQSAGAVEYTDCFFREVRPPPRNECPWYDTKQSNGVVPVKLWGMISNPSLPLFRGPLWPGVVAPDRVLSFGQIAINCVLMLNWIIWNRIVFTFNCG